MSNRRPLRPTYVGAIHQASISGPGGLRLIGDADTGCVWFEGVDGPGRIWPIWPEGFTGSFNPIRVYDAEGNLFAEEGQRYSSLGGSEAADRRDECRQTQDAVASWRVGEMGGSMPLAP